MSEKRDYAKMSWAELTETIEADLSQEPHLRDRAALTAVFRRKKEEWPAGRGQGGCQSIPKHWIAECQRLARNAGKALPVVEGMLARPQTRLTVPKSIILYFADFLISTEKE